MKARLLLKDKFTDEQGHLIERVVWSVPLSLLHPEGVRYRLAFIPRGTRGPAVLYDNHHSKGHHKHLEDSQEPYLFADVDQLMIDFENDIARWKNTRRPQ